MKARTCQFQLSRPLQNHLNVVINGLKWSEILDGYYENSDLDSKNYPIKIGTIQKSEATNACSTIGAEWYLPTREQYESLKEDYLKLIGISKAKLWTSSVFSIHVPTIAYLFNEATGVIDAASVRDIQWGIRCVAAATDTDDDSE